MTTRGHAALRYGGVVGRIAQAVLLSEDALLGPSDDVTEHGICFQNRRSNELYWDDELIAEELDLICGIYHVATGQRDHSAPGNRQTSTISWWPRPIYFEKSGLNVGVVESSVQGFLSKASETDRSRRDATLPTQGEWKNNMKFDSRVPAYIESAERCAAQVLRVLRPT
ncbi:hypothetical protein B0H14DRAFT_2763478 [Mycena olivaceomarginata]|nr:hypothetical protein B0H14DRAFT_2763478 [Mycena olivaceomarginata]